MIDLLPCPFCGGKASSENSDHGPYAWIACDECDARGPDCNYNEMGWEYPYLLWNRREEASHDQGTPNDRPARDVAVAGGMDPGADQGPTAPSRLSLPALRDHHTTRREPQEHRMKLSEAFEIVTEAAKAFKVIDTTPGTLRMVEEAIATVNDWRAIAFPKRRARILSDQDFLRFVALALRNKIERGGLSGARIGRDIARDIFEGLDVTDGADFMKECGLNNQEGEPGNG